MADAKIIKSAAKSPGAKAGGAKGGGAKGGGAKQAGRSGGSGSWRWLQGLVCGAVVTLATPTALLGVLLLAPALVAFLLDTAPGRPAARPMLLWGLAASVRPMVALWTGGHTNGHALELAGDVGVLATAWAAQAGGWLTACILPLFINVALDAAAATQAARLRHARFRHEEEWHIPPRDEEE